MARYSVDAEELLVTLVAASLPEAEVRAAPDVDTIDVLPLIIVSPGQGQSVDSQRGLGWVWQTHFSVLASEEEAASTLADKLYETIYSYANSWDPTVGRIVGVGAITNVEDISIFSRTVTTVTPAGGLTQFDGTFAITVRHA
jgi:hypothetical protein